MTPCFSAPATTARSCASTATAPARCSSTAARWKSTPWRPRPTGGLYVGTSPDGRIYRVDARGQATPFFDPEDKYIWALAVDAKGMVYAATGDKGDGVSHHAGRQGRSVLLDQDDARDVARLRSRRAAARRHRLAGPRVPRRPAGQRLPAARHDATRRSRRFDSTPKGALYVAAQSGRPAQGGEPSPFVPPSEPPPAAPVPQVSTEITSIAIIDVPVTPQPASPSGARAESRGPTGAVYRVLPDGLWDQLWESRDDAPYDIAFEADGSLLSRPAATARFSGWPAIRCGRRC